MGYVTDLSFALEVWKGEAVASGTQGFGNREGVGQAPVSFTQLNRTLDCPASEVKLHKNPEFQLTASDPGRVWVRRLGSWVGGVLLSGTLWKLFLLLFRFLGTGGVSTSSGHPHMITGQCSQFAGMSEDGPLVPRLDLYPLFSGLLLRGTWYLVCAFT